MLYQISSGGACLTCKMIADASDRMPDQPKPTIKLSQTPEVAQKVKPSVVPVLNPVPKKTYPCRWCSHERLTRSYCTACGRLSNTWSAAKAEGATPTAERDLSRMDILLELERRLIHEIEFFAREGLGQTFDEAISGFKQAVHRNAME